MNMMLNIFPYAGQVLLLAVLATVCFGRFVKNSRQRLAVVAGLSVLCLFFPVSGLSLGQWLRSVVGDLSVLTLVTFANILAQRLFDFNLVNPVSRDRMLMGVALLGLGFYPLALGVSAYDPYQWGYTPVLMSAFLVLASLIAWFRSGRDLAIILLLPLLAYNLRLLESANLWDYLIDPILVAYAFVQYLANSRFLRLKKLGPA